MTRYVEKQRRPNTVAAYKHILDDDVLVAWRGRALASIKRADVRDLVERIADERPISANRTLTVLAKCFKWAVERDIMETSPAIGVKKPADENPRDRVLTDAELCLVLDAAGRLPTIGRDFIRLLTLTMARRSEIANMRWTEVDLAERMWTLPAARAKNGCEHRLPLSSTAVSILTDREKDRGASPFVFAGRRGAYTSFAKLKTLLDAHIAEANGSPIPPWTLHDLRRSGASVMPRLGVTLPVTERVLNHISGSFSGIVKIYQRFDYLPEMAEALQRWDTHLLAIIQAGNVTEFRRRA